MLKFKKIFLIFLLISLLVLFWWSFNFSLAQWKPELKYPEIGQWRPQVIEETDILPKYIKYIFTLVVVIVGLVALSALIYGGFRYLTSAGSPAALTDAKERIIAGLLGLIIIFSSYLILTTINPQLVILGIGKPEPGKFTWRGGFVYFYLRNVKEPLKFSYNDPELPFPPGQVEKIKVENPQDWDEEKKEMVPRRKYALGAILHTEKKYKGGCRLFMVPFHKLDETWDNLDKNTKFGSLLTLGPAGMGLAPEVSSLNLFYRVPEKKSYGYVEFCPKVNLEGDCRIYTAGEEPFTLPDHLRGSALNPDGGVWSMEITGNYLVVLFDKVAPLSNKTPTKCQVFRGPAKYDNLEKADINKCGLFEIFGRYYWHFSCVQSAFIIPYLPAAWSIEELDKKIGITTFSDLETLGVPKKTEVEFTINYDKWRINWHFKPNLLASDKANFDFSILREDKTLLMTKKGITTEQKGIEELSGKGKYFLIANVKYGSWSIKIEPSF